MTVQSASAGERRSWLLMLGALIAVGIALRAPTLGHPLIDIDEQFYLLVGERMWQGALPYIDIWDRKPVGLFLLFAGTRLLGGEGVLQYQIVAACSAIATAVTIATIARTFTDRLAAIVGGLVYLVWLNFFGGGGGQSPIFYNLAMAIGAGCVLRAIAAGDAKGSARSAFGAMAALGIAIQLKPTVVFEGAVFGFALLAVRWRSDRNLARLVRHGIALAATALAPTIVAFVYYALIGHADAFLYANVTSIFQRNTPPQAPVWSNLGYRFVVLGPLIVASGVGLFKRASRDDFRILFLICWTLAAFVGLLAIKPYYNHYALPVLVPLSIGTALAAGRHRLWAVGVLVAGLIWLNLSGFFATYLTSARDARAAVARTTAVIVPHLHGGCLWVFAGPPVLYHSTKACLATAYAFPVHLNYMGEDGAIGVDTAQEVARTLAGRPAVIATFAGDSYKDYNPRTWALVRSALASDYRQVGQEPIGGGLLHIYARDEPRGSVETMGLRDSGRSAGPPR